MSFLFRKPAYQAIDAEGYQETFQTQAHQLIDVRSVEEYRGGHLPKAINIPLQDLPNRLSEISQDQPVILVCASGNRSGQAANFLLNQGYDGEQVYNLKGGTFAWRAKRLPLEN